MKLYKTEGWGDLIEEVEPVKVTEHSVWLSNGRNAKKGIYVSYWDTLEEAKEHLKQKYNRIIEDCERKIDRAKSKLEELKNY